MEDNKVRCSWVNLKNENYVRYHDDEWGKVTHDDEKLYEMLILECFQAGLSWECVLNKREGFRVAFSSFDPLLVSSYDDSRIEELMHDGSIIRNRAKIEAAINNTKVYLAIKKEWGSFSSYLWHFTDGEVVYERGATRSKLSDAVSKDLKKRGMRFVGSITIYSYLQAIGIINSHDEKCFCMKKGPYAEPKERTS